jgi:hypothetical protein
MERIFQEADVGSDLFPQLVSEFNDVVIRIRDEVLTFSNHFRVSDQWQEPLFESHVEWFSVYGVGGSPLGVP